MPEAEAAFEPVALLKALVRSGVDFIVVGGMAATMHGSPVATTDVDIVPRRERANLQRLSDALDGLEARVYVSRDESHRFAHDGSSLGDAAVWNLATRWAGVIDLDGVPIRIAALDDVIRSKAAANRDKDRATLPLLRRLQDLSETTRSGRRAKRPGGRSRAP
ncbi:MAG: hypothetical protein E6I84_14685 [Chloroflexi bacterium]|nr:MAG: hypothetical protein E6I84_14685 [Chloroflexota bacterium]